MLGGVWLTKVCVCLRYFDDPRFDAEFLLNGDDEEVAFGLRKSLSYVVQWITNMLYCRRMVVAIERDNAMLQALDDSETSFKEAWSAKKVRHYSAAAAVQIGDLTPAGGVSLDRVSCKFSATRWTASSRPTGCAPRSYTTCERS